MMKTTVNNIYLTLVFWLCTAATAQATILPTYSNQNMAGTRSLHYQTPETTLSPIEQPSQWKGMYRSDKAIVPHAEYVGNNYPQAKPIIAISRYSVGENNTISTTGYFSALQMSREGSATLMDDSKTTTGGPRKINRPNEGNPMGGVNTPIGDTLVPLLIALLMYTIVVARRRPKETLQ